MYTTPFSIVFNVWNARSSKVNIVKSLEELTQKFNSHPFATTGSLEYCKLEYLSDLIAKWMSINHPESGEPAEVCSHL